MNMVVEVRSRFKNRVTKQRHSFFFKLASVLKAGTMSGEKIFFEKALEIVDILDGAFDTTRIVFLAPNKVNPNHGFIQ